MESVRVSLLENNDVEEEFYDECSKRKTGGHR